MTRDTETRRANDLDSTITALLTHTSDQAPDDTAAPEVRLVAAVVRLGASLAPADTFAADLEARLLTAPDPAAPSTPPAGDGHNGHNRGGGRAARLGDPRSAWRWWLPLAAMVVLTLLTLLLVPPAQAGLQTLIRIGAVRIGLVPPAQPTRQPGSSVTPTPTPLPSPLDLAGATTLAQARAQAGFALLLPTYPLNLGPPQHVFLQDLDGPMVALVWTDAAQPSRVRLALFEMSNGLYVYKSGAQVVAETTVHGQPALWTQGPYIVQVLVNGQVVTDTRRLVTGHVLIWTENGITYRLETDGTLDEAVRIAESLR